MTMMMIMVMIMIVMWPCCLDSPFRREFVDGGLLAGHRRRHATGPPFLLITTLVRRLLAVYLIEWTVTLAARHVAGIRRCINQKTTDARTSGGGGG
jgi:hypothetical protein